MEELFKNYHIDFCQTDISDILFFKSFSEKLKNYLSCMGKTIRLHVTEYGSAWTTLYSVKEIMDEQETICGEKGLLIIGFGLNGDFLTVNLQNNHVGYLFHDDLWEGTYESLEEIYCEMPFEIDAFIKMALEDETYPIDGTDAENFVNQKDIQA